jgi:hypothetical protein
MKHYPACLFVLMVILLSACQSSLISDLVTRSGEKLFWDDYSDSSGNWPQVSDQNGSLGIVNGAYQIEVLTTHYEVLATPGHTFRDVQVEVDAARLSGPVQNLFGLACRSTDLNNFYFLVISSDGYYALGKIRNGKTYLLGQEMMSPSTAIIQGDGTNHLRLECIGETLRGYVNDQAIAISNDADFSSGEAGLVAGTLDTPGVVVTFDNFVVYKP